MDTNIIVYDSDRVIHTYILEKKYRKNLKAGLKKFISQCDLNMIKGSTIPSYYLERFPNDCLPKINICHYILGSLKKDKSKLELNMSHIRQIKKIIDIHCDYSVYDKVVRDVFYL